MKIISAMFGGSVSSDDKNFFRYANKELEGLKSFPVVKYFKQSLIFIILKLLSIKILYRLFFFQILKGLIVRIINFSKHGVSEYEISKNKVH